MKLHYSDSKPVPVSLSIVVLCDLRVLVKWSNAQGLDEKCPHFPYGYFGGRDGQDSHVVRSLDDLGNVILNDALDEYEVSLSWIPVDVRSLVSRSNQDLSYSVDIGYMSILNAPDLPYLVEGYTWELVNLDEDCFPYELDSDHNNLWEAARNMFNMMK